MKYLSGSVVVYVIVAACGNEPSGGISGGGAASGSGAIPDAKAQAGCGPCVVQGTVRTVTADTDPAQAVGASVAMDSAWRELAPGPLYLTDVRLGPGSLSLAIVGASEPCGGEPFATLTTDLGSGTPIHGARIFIAAGEKLCALAGGGVLFRWAGFRPY